MEHDALINIEKQVQSATASYGVNESISFSCPSVEAEILNLNNDWYYYNYPFASK